MIIKRFEEIYWKLSIMYSNAIQDKKDNSVSVHQCYMSESHWPHYFPHIKTIHFPIILNMTI